MNGAALLASASVVGSGLLAWAAGVLMLAVAWRVSRGGGAYAVQELSEANRVLERRVQQLGAEVRDLKIENAELRARTNFAVVMAEHERKAEQRHTATLNVLNLIADRLGPDQQEEANR